MQVLKIKLFSSKFLILDWLNCYLRIINFTLLSFFMSKLNSRINQKKIIGFLEKFLGFNKYFPTSEHCNGPKPQKLGESLIHFLFTKLQNF